MIGTASHRPSAQEWAISDEFSSLEWVRSETIPDCETGTVAGYTLYVMENAIGYGWVIVRTDGAVVVARGDHRTKQLATCDMHTALLIDVARHENR